MLACAGINESKTEMNYSLRKKHLELARKGPLSGLESASELVYASIAIDRRRLSSARKVGLSVDSDVDITGESILSAPNNG